MVDGQVLNYLVFGVQKRKPLSVFLRFVKHYEVELYQNDTLGHLLDLFRKKLEKEGKKAHANLPLHEWVRYYEISVRCRRVNEDMLKENMEELGIVNESTISVYPSLMLSGENNIDQKGGLICAVTRKKTDDPVLLNPGCMHVVDRQVLAKWIKVQGLTCPLCKAQLPTLPMRSLVETEVL